MLLNNDRENLLRCANALERIADVLEKHFDNQAELDGGRASWREMQGQLWQAQRRVEELERLQSAEEPADAIHKAFLRAKAISPEPDSLLVPNPDGLTDEELTKKMNEDFMKRVESHNEKVLIGEATGYLGR